MIMVIALALAQPAAVPADSEITVLARRLNSWRGDWRLKGDTIRCKTTRSTGDRAIDAIGCKAFVACLTPRVPELKNIEASRVDQQTRNAMLLGIMESSLPCIDEARRDGIAALAQGRGAI